MPGELTLALLSSSIRGAQKRPKEKKEQEKVLSQEEEEEAEGARVEVSPVRQHNKQLASLYYGTSCVR